MSEPRCGVGTSSSRWRPNPPARACAVGLLISIGFGDRERCVGTLRGAEDVDATAWVGVNDACVGVLLGVSGAFGVVTPDADTGEVSGKLGPLRANVFQNQEGVNLDDFSDGRLRLELRELVPMRVVDGACETVDAFDLPERIDDCDGELLRAGPLPVTDSLWSDRAVWCIDVSAGRSTIIACGLSSIGGILDSGASAVLVDRERLSPSLLDL